MVFSGCNTVNGQINLTFSNSNITFGNQNIDSLVFLWPDSTTSILTDSLLLNFLLNGSVSNTFTLGSVNQTFSVIAYNSDGCSYSTDYTVLSGGFRKYKWIKQYWLLIY